MLPYASRRNLSLLVLAASLGALGIALLSQYGFGLQPCHLCYWQRVPYAIIAVCVFWAFLRPRFAATLLWLCVFAFVADAAIAAFHAGVEWQWWQGLESCSGTVTNGMSIEEIRARILGAAAVSCSEAAFRFLGLSMAGWNALYAIACAVLLAAYLKRMKP